MDNIKLSSNTTTTKLDGLDQAWQILDTWLSVSSSHIILTVIARRPWCPWAQRWPWNLQDPSPSTIAISILGLRVNGRDNQERKRLVLAGVIRQDFMENGTWIKPFRIWRDSWEGHANPDRTAGRGRDDPNLCVLGRKVWEGDEGKDKTMRSAPCRGKEESPCAWFGWVRWARW